MYTLELYDGTRIENLRYIHPNTLELASNDYSIYWLLSEYNLSFAFLFDEDNMLAAVYIDCRITNYCCQGDGKIRFRISSIPQEGGKKKK